MAKKKEWKRTNLSTNFDRLKEIMVGHTITDMYLVGSNHDNSFEMTLDDGTIVEFEECGDDMSSIQYIVRRYE